MALHQSVNRDDELALFDKLVSGEMKEQILLIRAKGGMGKSILLREYMQRCPKQTLTVIVDFKNKGIGLAELISRICDRLGRDQLPNLMATIGRFTIPTSVNIADNSMQGQTDIDIALMGQDEETREFRRTALATALFDDIKTLGQIVFIFDTFEHCDDVVKEWLLTSLICRFPDVKNVVGVIAGRKIPDPTLEWIDASREITLQGIANRYWHIYAQALGLKKSAEWINGYCTALNGHPLSVAQKLESEAQGGMK